MFCKIIYKNQLATWKGGCDIEQEGVAAVVFVNYAIRCNRRRYSIKTRRKKHMLKKIIPMYMIYVIYFLGIGMVSSGIVLMPFNYVRYSIILATGLILFSSGSYINEFVIDKKEASLGKVIHLIVVSLTLAIGIGMISGGISHFKESPVYVSYLIPLGIVVSFISYTIKNGYVLNKKEKMVLISGILAIGLVAHVGLSTMANNYLANADAPQGGDVFMKKH